MKGKWYFRGKKYDLWLLLIWLNASNRSNNRHCFSRADELSISKLINSVQVASIARKIKYLFKEKLAQKRQMKISGLQEIFVSSQICQIFSNIRSNLKLMSNFSLLPLFSRKNVNKKISQFEVIPFSRYDLQCFG